MLGCEGCWLFGILLLLLGSVLVIEMFGIYVLFGVFVVGVVVFFNV